MKNADLYSFWISDSIIGSSEGYVAGGAVNQDGLVDTALSHTNLCDCNNDNSTNIIDLVRMKKYIASLGFTVEKLDIDANGVINTEDMTVLKKYLLGCKI